MTLERRDVLKLAALAAWSAVATAGFALPALAGREDYATGEMALGADDAPVTVIEYASMTCPHCATFHDQTFGRLKGGYIDSGKVRFIYREFPLDRLALMAAMLARCAGPKRFFPFIAMMFRHQQKWARANNPVEELAKLARLGGVGREDFDACMKDEELLDSILKTRLEGANDFGVNSTPSFIIDGQKYSGALSYEQMARIIDPLLPAN